MRIGIDMDGVLADFCTDFQRVLAEVTDGRLRPFPKSGPTVWDWPQLELGYTDEEVGKAWAKITQPESRFWLTHSCISIFGMEAVADLSHNKKHAIYFITDRGGPVAYANAKWQTEEWLEDRGVRIPTVIIARDKGTVAKGLALDFMVDDRPENLFAVADASRTTRLYLIRTAYNEWAWGDRRITPVANVESVLLTEGI